MLAYVIGALLAVGGGLCAYLYFRPPQVTAVSEDTLQYLEKLKGRQGYSEEDGWV